MSVQSLSVDVQAMRAQARVSQARLRDRTAPAEDFGPSPGATPGVEVWRVEQLKVVAVPKASHGKFYSGDSYIVLHTRAKAGNSRALEWDLYFWLGAETSQDEAAVAAYKTVELDDRLGGSPVQHREVQGHESKDFLATFPAVRYLKGGVAGGLRAANAGDPHKPTLLRCKGRKAVVVTELPCKCSSLNHGDVFVLDAGATVYQWQGAESNRRERTKALEVAISVRDVDNKGKSTLAIVDDGADPTTDADARAFFALLEGNPADILPAAAGGDDDGGAAGARAHATSKRSGGFGGSLLKWGKKKTATPPTPPKLFRIADAPRGGGVKLTAAGPGPQAGAGPGRGGLRREDLDDNDAFLLDAGAGVFVWIGRKASSSERAAAMNLALKYLASARLPTHTPVQRVTSGAEPTSFTVHFGDWHAANAAPVPTGDMHAFARSQARVAGAQQGEMDGAIARSMLAAPSSQDIAAGPLSRAVATPPSPDELKVYRIEQYERKEVDPADYGLFTAGDCFVIVHAESGPDGRPGPRTVYFWQGASATQDERGAAALQAVDLSDALGGGVPQVRVCMGHEPLRFLSLFQGRFISFRGDAAVTGFRSAAREPKALDRVPGRGLLLHVRGTQEMDVHAVEVTAQASALNSADCFIATTALSAANGAVDSAAAPPGGRVSRSLPSWMTNPGGGATGAAATAGGFTIFIWHGKAALPEERAAAAALAEVLRAAVQRGRLPGDSAHAAAGREARLVPVEEGAEPAAFWAALGGKDGQAAPSVGPAPSGGRRTALWGNAAYDLAALRTFSPRLFNLSDRTGAFKVRTHRWVAWRGALGLGCGRGHRRRGEGLGSARVLRVGSRARVLRGRRRRRFPTLRRTISTTRT